MIKKAFQPILNLLEANPAAKVRDILEQVKELAAAKSAGGGAATTFHKNEAGEVVAVKCYYHGLWMHPALGGFGVKASSASGFNSMCKDGLSKWTKQQRDAKNAKEQLLGRAAKGEEGLDLQAELAAIEAAKDQVIAREDGYGFATLEECLADNASKGI